MLIRLTLKSKGGHKPFCELNLVRRHAIIARRRVVERSLVPSVLSQKGCKLPPHIIFQAKGFTQPFL